MPRSVGVGLASTARVHGSAVTSQRTRFALGASIALAWRAMAVHDRMAIGYLAVLAGSLWTVPAHLVRYEATALLACVTAVIVALRSSVEPPAWLVMVYRLAMVASVLGSYLLLGDALPLLNARSYDVALYRLDVALFGVEPAVLFADHESFALTEWFACFYLSYFALLVVFIVPVAVAVRSSRFARELVMGLIGMYAVGQTLYALVPGYGPWHAMPEIFARPLVGGFFFERMMAAVHRAGAQKDIFPSLHVAVAVFLSMLAFRHRRGRVLRLAWPVVAGVATNLVLATLYLRWHYLVDVIAGVILGVGAHTAAARIALREAQHRRAGLGAAWPALRAR